jgi:hypothetical protein
MNSYNLFIVLPTLEWHDKIISKLISFGWSVSAAGDKKSLVENGPLGGIISLIVEKVNLDYPNFRDEIRKILKEMEISYYAVIVVKRDHACLACGVMEFSKEK